MMIRTIAAVALGLLGSASLAQAQGGNYNLHEKGIERLNEARTVAPLSVDTLFGDQVSRFDGTTEFQAVDISISGNDSLPVELRRTLKIDDRSKINGNHYGGFEEWNLDVPHLATEIEIAKGWRNNRCSAPGPLDSTATVAAEDYWGGFRLHVPGVGGQQLLMSPSSMLPVAGGGPHPWITRDMWRISCKTSTRNGYAGEAFVALSPEGVKYHLDWVVTRNHSGVNGELNSWPVARNVLYFLVSRIEDRFGNTVDYTWSGDKLTGISASDGRQITLTWSGNRITTATSSIGTWSYAYTGSKLSQVTLPDASTWTYASTGGLALMPATWSPGIENPTGCPDSLEAPTGSYALTITAPSGAVGQFTFDVRQHWRSNIPESACYINSPQYWFMKVPRFHWSLSLITKQVSGPGLATMTWNHAYGGAPIMFDHTKQNTVSGPEGTWTRYTFGTGYSLNEGQLLKTEHGGGPTSILRTVAQTYVSTAEAAGQNFPAAVGVNPRMWSDPLSTSWLRPLRQAVTTQQGVDFSWQVGNACSGKLCFDAFGRPTRVTKSSTLAGTPTRTEQTTYHDNPTVWVLGQVAKVMCVAPTTALPAGCGSPGVVMAETSYHPTYALPLVSKRFGKTVQTLGWDTTATVASGQRGTVRTVADGAGNTITLASWKRGVPQSITFPATPEAPSGATQSAVVDNAGRITATTDETGYTTHYTHDAMGRLASIAWPTGDAVAWNTTTQAFQQIANAEYGIPAGHWRQTVATGNGRKVTYFDGLWRPLVTREYDTANEAGTQRFQRFTYDHAGRTTFASYPATVHNPSTGTWSEYDPLGRPTSVAQDSELGLLTTVTQYLTGFETRVTSPKSHQTTTRFLAWDQPATDLPVYITHPESAFTHITRDVFGKPTVIRRSNSSSPTGGSLAVNRSYSYNGHQELCRSVEPETGATLMGYDSAGNIKWSAAGLPTSQACEAHGTSPAVALRRVDRTYDARNRIKTLAFPDGNGDQTWDYYADGLPQQISTWNIGFPGADPKETRNLYTYNKRRLPKTELIAVPAWYTFSVEHGYNANGHETSLSYPSGHVVTTTVNALGQPTAITGGTTTYASGITHHPNGAVAGFTYGNGIVHTMAQNGRTLPGLSKAVFGGSEFMHDAYAYDEHANVDAITDLRIGKGGWRTRTMSYDGLDRLTSVASQMYGTTGANYTYNVLDDIRTVTIGGAQARNHDYCYDANRRLTAVRTGGCGGTLAIGLAYDVQGNLASKGAQGYRFDFGNRLREVDGVERYRYDGHGRRVLAMQFSTGTVLSQYGLDGKLLYQKSDRTGLQTVQIYLGGSLIAIREQPISGAGAAVVKYQHTDALGSPVVVTLQDRSIVEESEYEPYGQVLNRPRHDGPGYTGHVEDAATGLVYMQQRYYDPGIGRFVSVDPVSANANTGAGFNRYAYAANNPYKFTDPDGRCEKITGSNICQRSLTGTVTRFMLPAQGKTDMAKTQRSWPVPGHTKLNAADKPREGRGEFGSPRNTSRGRSTHTGIDIEAPKGARVVAPQDGAVVDIRPNPSGTYGNQVVLDHGNGVFSQSAHLDTVAVKPGALVNGGQDIGTVGRTGNTPSLGDSHLHFEIRLNGPAPRAAGGTVVDPLPYLPEP